MAAAAVDAEGAVEGGDEEEKEVDVEDVCQKLRRTSVILAS